MSDAVAQHEVSLSEAFRVWVRVAALSFGGPAAQIAVMHRIIVEEKRWISDSRFLHALSYCTLLPGPEAQQLATYIGWLMNRTAGGLMAGLLFIAPGVVTIMALSAIYAGWRQVDWVAAAFFGLKAAVLSIVVEALLRLGRRALRNRFSQALALLAFVAIFFFAAPFPLIVVAAAIVGYVGAKLGHPAFAPGVAAHDKNVADTSLLGDRVPSHATPSGSRAIRTACVWTSIWIAPVLGLIALLGPENIFSRLAVFFSEVAFVTFGGAYAILAYIAQEVVNTQHWLRATEMLDGLGMAETTPGPLIMVLQFVGFMAAYRTPGALTPMIAGALGGLVTTYVTFAPCFLWIFLGGPYIEKLRGNRSLAGALSAITAAVGGIILNLAIWFAVHSMFRATALVDSFGLHFDAPVLASIDWWALALAIAAAVAIFRFKVGMIPTLAACCVAGVALWALGLRA